MARLAERLGTITRDRQPLVARWRALIADPREDVSGMASHTLSGHLRLLAVAAYALDQDVQRFCSLLRESASLVAGLYDRFNAGESIDESFVSWMGYRSVFDALAVGDTDLAGRLAMKLGGRPQIERKHDHSFTRAIGLALKQLVLGATPDTAPSVAAFAQVCLGKGNTGFTGYAASMQAILDENVEAMRSGIEMALDAHPALCTRGRMFDLTPDEVIPTWALGLVNLAFSRGLAVRIEHPLLPAPLMVSAPGSPLDPARI